jgi:hypothetical protein
MNRVLLVDFESADREAGKASLTEMGCMVTGFGGNFESRMSAYGHKEAGKPFDAAPINLFASRDPAADQADADDRNDRPVPTGFELALRVNDLGITRVAVAGADRVLDREFQSVLELQKARAIGHNDGIILSVDGNAVVPFKGSVKNWGRTYQKLVEAAPYPIEQEA